MTESKHTIQELQQLQALPLDLKIALTKSRIRAWVNEFGTNGVYVSFSGGKDSTVLLRLVREEYPNVPAVFFDTGLEYPEIRDFVKTYDNVEWVKPKLTFRETVEKYGYPIISKEVAECVFGARKYLKKVLTDLEQEADASTNERTPYSYFYDKLCGRGVYESAKMKIALIADSTKAIDNFRIQRLMGILSQTGKATAESIPSLPNRSKYSCQRYQFFLDADFEIGNQCCKIMKKNPARDYKKATGRVPITAMMASESRLRTQAWLKAGCNAFDAGKQVSNPMAFWTEQDVLLNKIPIASVYGEVIKEGDCEADGQMSLFELERPTFRTTGLYRTGCMFCLFGIHLEREPNKLQQMKVTHPKTYQWMMKPESEGGLGYKEKIDWINKHGNMHIKYE
jgi:3'-phosphoadenosine 5'-phosphosulfate sulfotransferase (PAPS reductase)/FAD synthetase